MALEILVEPAIPYKKVNKLVNEIQKLTSGTPKEVRGLLAKLNDVEGFETRLSDSMLDHLSKTMCKENHRLDTAGFLSGWKKTEEYTQAVKDSSR